MVFDIYMRDIIYEIGYLMIDQTLTMNTEQYHVPSLTMLSVSRPKVSRIYHSECLLLVSIDASFCTRFHCSLQNFIRITPFSKRFSRGLRPPPPAL